jgi:hypothetical protein
LKKIRTSPDHGTAYDIAGKGIANYESFREAVFTAVSIFKKRNDYNSFSENPLEIQPRKTFSKKK